MEWQPETSGWWVWFDDLETRSEAGHAPASAPTRPKRWMLHGAHGGRGVVASSSQGPHVAPKPGRGSR